MLELKRSTVSIYEGIRPNLDNQKHIFIKPFFSTIQCVMAGNDIEEIAHGAIETKEKNFGPVQLSRIALSAGCLLRLLLIRKDLANF